MRNSLILLALLLLAAGSLGAVEANTAINVSPQQSVSPFNVPVQIALTTSEVGVNLTQSTPGYWVIVQLVSPSAWTYRSTSGSTTTAIPVLANQVLTIVVMGLGQQTWAVGSTTQTLYVVPLYYVRAAP
jgi:hypothetical protein